MTTPKEVLSRTSSWFDAEVMIDFTDMLYSLDPHHLPRYEEARDALSFGQLVSKLWLVEMLDNKRFLTNANVLICGGWLGTLGRLILEAPNSFRCSVTSMDIDPRCKLISESFNKRYVEIEKFKGVTADMYDFDYSPFDIIINTSSEHIASIQDWMSLIPSGKTVVLQNNNAFNIPEHISCVKSAQELVEQASLSTFFCDELVFPMYTRYMIGGIT